MLIHIGYHKTGTNWLQRVLFSDPDSGFHWLGKKPGSHPVRRFVRDAPLEFDAAAAREELAPLVERAAGREPVISFERLSGHPLSGGFDSRQIADRLHETYPDAKILIATREQRSAIVSIWKGYVQQGGALPLGRFVDPPTSKSRRVPQFDWRFFEYDRLVAYYRGLFGAENVLAMALEQFVADGRSYVERIGLLAGRPIPPEVLDRLPYTRRENVRTVSAATLALTRRLNLLGPRTEVNPSPPVQSKRVGRYARQFEQRDVLGRFAKADARLRHEVDEWAGDRYAESNRRLGELIGVDLGALGWRT